VIRAWYNKEIARVPLVDADLVSEGKTPEERAQAAHELRHHARVTARALMANK
jgi:hypothetical protein